ncbi:MAG: peptide-methionine (S)-S-oxide reductase [Pyrinomonadaceae bacterium]|nr:peptide-methionine (S)-S-oxide reductase [Pyrinomonadaceae bacterium]
MDVRIADAPRVQRSDLIRRPIHTAALYFLRSAKQHQDVDDDKRHGEVVQIRFDSAQHSYADLPSVDFTVHDSTPLDRQGCDIGPSYRSAIIYHSNEQRQWSRPR